jgi:hypothetical protein
MKRGGRAAPFLFGSGGGGRGGHAVGSASDQQTKQQAVSKGSKGNGEITGTG